MEIALLCFVVNLISPVSSCFGKYYNLLVSFLQTVVPQTWLFLGPKFCAVKSYPPNLKVSGVIKHIKFICFLQNNFHSVNKSILLFSLNFCLDHCTLHTIHWTLVHYSGNHATGTFTSHRHTSMEKKAENICK